MTEGPNYYYYYPTSLPLSIPGVAGSIVRFHSIISKKRTRKPCRETLWRRVPIIIIIIPPLFPYPYLVLHDPLSGLIHLSARKEPGNHAERHYDRGSQLLLLLSHLSSQVPLSIPGVAGSIVRSHSLISKKRTRKPCWETLWRRVPIIIIIIPPLFPYPYLVLQDPWSGFIQLSERKEPGNHAERHYDGESQLLLSHPSSPIHTWCCRIHCQVSFNYQ